MKRLNPGKLFVEYRGEVSPQWPIIPRLYTLTHSDETGELFLTIGDLFAKDKITSNRDEVLAEWIPYGTDDVALTLYVFLDTPEGYEASINRNAIFVRELPLALEAIRYGDRKFFESFPQLDSSPVLIQFTSMYPELNRVEYWGKPADYR